MRRLFHRYRIPIIYVTHDQEEAFSLATQAALLHEGRIIQTGSPAELTARPATSWVAKFLALGNLIPARVVRSRPMRVETECGILPALAYSPSARVGKTGWLLLRPGGGVLRPGAVRKSGGIRGVVTDCSLRGSGYEAVLQCGLVEIKASADKPAAIGATVAWHPQIGQFLCE